jgi:hypothetical protein
MQQVSPLKSLHKVHVFTGKHRQLTELKCIGNLADAMLELANSTVMVAYARKQTNLPGIVTEQIVCQITGDE